MNEHDITDVDCYLIWLGLAAFNFAAWGAFFYLAFGILQTWP